MITLGNIVATNAPCELNLTTLLETRMLVQANSGGGKSYALRRLLEQTASSVQQLVIDPEGEFASLREKFDYVIAAPQDGDALATPQTATLLARRLLESGVSAILNIYELKAHERVLFVRRFLEALVNAPKALWHPVLIALDEAHVFAPQVGSAESLQAVSDIATRGRKRGQCLIAATQRLSKLHKDVAAELGNKMIGRTGLDVDVKRAADELGLSSRDAIESLRNLNAGEFFVFGPALTRAVEKIKVGQVRTTHPKAGHRMLEAPPAPSAKLRAQLAKLSDLQKDAEAEIKTLDDLKKENARLKSELKRGGAVNESSLRNSIRASVAQEFVAKDREAKRVVTELHKQISAVRRHVESLDKLTAVSATFQPEPPNTTGSHATDSPRREAPIVQPPSRDSRGARPAAADASAAGATGLSGPEQRIIDAIAWMNAIGVDEPDQTVVAFLAGYTGPDNGAYKNPRGQLNARAIVRYPGDGKIALTAEGESLANHPGAATSMSELHRRVMAKIGGPERRILEPLLAAYPASISNDDLAVKAAYSDAKNGAYKNPRGRLRSWGLIEYRDGGVRACDFLFPERT